MFAFIVGAALSAQASPPKPNIVWIVAEDLSPSLGCYGDPDAITPNLDAFAKQGTRFNKCFTHAPVCAPSRSGLITGMYPTTLGSHHMRSKLVETPPLFSDELKKAGYSVFWPGKTDFNFDVPRGWADTRDWTKKPDVLPTDRPFFAYINIGVTHESQIRANPDQYRKNTLRLTPAEFRDPAKVRLPPYYPDHSDVRRNVATYHENATAMDKIFGDILRLLDDRKLRDNTIVFFFGDHGWGMPRGKRWCYDSGSRAPLIIRWPGTVEAGAVRDDLVAFLDFPTTVLAIAGAEPPKRMQGHVFLGAKRTPRRYAFTARDRMDETYDRIRSVRSDRYRYVRNFHPELPHAQWINYADEMPTLQVWRKLAFENKLNPIQAAFFSRTKPNEELYDLDSDPHETRNLADSIDHRAILAEHRQALDGWMKETNDLGAVPERELIKRGLVRDLLNKEYEERVKLHPKASPVPFPAGDKDGSSRTVFQAALERGCKPGGNLSLEVGRLKGDEPRTVADINAICETLEKLLVDPKLGGNAALDALNDEFEKVQHVAGTARDILKARGTPILARIVESALRDRTLFPSRVVLNAVKILAAYETKEGADAVILAAKTSLQSDEYGWGDVFKAFHSLHPYRDQVFRTLGESPPEELIGVLLMDAANRAVNDDKKLVHPFDNERGIAWIEERLKDPDWNCFSYARSAVRAMPFLKRPESKRLWEIAYAHPNADNRADAMRAAYEAGRPDGVDRLVKACFDAKCSARAVQYLKEIEREHLIPAATKAEEFELQAQFAEWLAHPNELMRSPDELEIYDRRELKWPPEGEKKRMLLIRYRMKSNDELFEDEVGVGVGCVGVFVQQQTLGKPEQRPPEDCYALQCIWQLQGKKLFLEKDVPLGSHAFDHLLRDCPLGGLTKVTIEHVAEISPTLKYGRTHVGLASAMRDGKPGWVALDGPRSAWYAKDEMPEDEYPPRVLSLHVGRNLLGFQRQPDRRKFLRPPTETPERLIKAFERSLKLACSGDPKHYKRLMWGRLRIRFREYIAARIKLGASKHSTIVETYEPIVEAALKLPFDTREKAFDSNYLIAEQFDDYADSLIALGRAADMPRVIEKFRPHWKQFPGDDRLGTAAFRAGHDRLAEQFLAEIPNDASPYWPRRDAVIALAEIRHRQGRLDEARSLLHQALKFFLEESRKTDVRSEQKRAEVEFQKRRSTYLRLFHVDGEESLKRTGIPSTTLRS